MIDGFDRALYLTLTPPPAPRRLAQLPPAIASVVMRPDAFQYASHAAYLWDQLDHARRFAQPLLEAHRFFVRAMGPDGGAFGGLPHVTTVWMLLAGLGQLAGDFAGLRQLTSELERDMGLSSELPRVEAVERGDLRPLVDAAGERLAREPDQPAALWRLQQACLHLAGGTALPAELLRALEELAPLRSAERHEWDWDVLDAVAALARYGLALISADPELEGHRGRFLAARPRLCRVDELFTFQLHGFQERLKAEYQAGRRSR